MGQRGRGVHALKSEDFLVLNADFNPEASVS